MIVKEMPECILCRSVLHEKNAGIIILGKGICSVCEQKITDLAWDDPDYDTYISGLKKIWRCKEA
ncbi:Inhibitor of sigma-G Gin [Desulforamulus putei DSM 12395]|uniref:Inhibitor of sigma-G Gin n=2 Tax=Desulforamulus putei TaxID=74701 RepID=A0A1M4Z181_9FIRM|nr:Inhibitor of sigma-G Gin [Desulforamulus putei DSM 12395]